MASVAGRHAYFLFTFFAKMGMNFYLAMLLAIVAVMMLGFIYERSILKPLRKRSIDTVMLSMIGFSLLIQNIAMLIWTPVPEAIKSPFPLTSYTLAGLYFLPQRIMVIVAALLLVILTHLLLKKTKIGKAMRATFQDIEAASLMGIKIDRIYSFTFVLGAGLAAAAGTLLGPIFTVHPYIGNLANAKAFVIVIIGGLGSFPGAITAGLLLGVFESLGAGYISSGYQDAIGFILLILILIYRPTGLYGKVGQTR